MEVSMVKSEGIELLDAGNEEPFLSGPDYIRKWGYEVNEAGTVRYTN